ncbi:MAG TPA: carboxypeptidase-like regulatory domain-containing protein [Terriglobia bacterium]|nr:carboxypeptidase-like regulatory domain-containing protein [Terriglobia bacterium]
MPVATAQTSTTGAISGTVTDPSGGVVPNATVTATSTGTGASRTVQTGPSGTYAFPQLALGEYRISVKAPGFRSADVGPINVQVAQAVTQNVTLELGEATQTVEVTAQGAMIQVDNPNTTTTVSAQSIANLPNPGGDLTFEAQFAPGGVMNNTGGYGNVEFNGLPATSNNFTIDGLDANDPFLNLNNSGATNLQLGLDAIQEVSVNTTSYATDQGRLGASQINYTTKSGTNQFHGQLHEIWNGSKFNSVDYFVNATGGSKPRSNVNEFGGNIGGPIVKDKWFFFGDVEGTRIAIPILQSNITYPSAAYQSTVLSSLGTGGFDPVFGRNLPAQPAEAPFYQNIFKLYGTQTGNPLAEIGCPYDVGGTPNANVDGNGCAVQRTFNLINFAKETLITAKVDRAGDKNQLWWRFQMDQGQQPTYKDPINSAFDAISIQPERNGNAGWTHTFGPTLVNNFNPGFAWYSAIFAPQNLSQTLNTFPEVLVSPFTGLGGIDYVWPQGRNVTQWQLNDTFTWTKGKHEIKFGENMRRVLVSDHDFGLFNTPLIEQFDLPAFQFGAADLSVQNFPITLVEPIGIVNLDTFFDDTFKVTPKFTFTYGVRATWNSDPKNQQNLYAALPGDFYSISHDVNQPLNQVLKPGQQFLFPQGTPLIFWQPRGAIAYQLKSNTVIRGGFGVFSDIFPASLADSMAQNPPYDPEFVGGPFGSPGIGGNAIAPGVPGSIIGADMAANQAFQSAFTSGALSCAAPTPPTNCVPSAGLTAVPNGQMQYPYSMQWSLGVEQQWANSWALQVQYVGTRAVHQPFSEQVNGFQTACAGCFSPWPFNAPADQRLGGVTQYVAGAMSTYTGLQTSVTKRLGHGLQFTGNYTWSHCLDTISNAGGGFSPTSQVNPIPGELNRYYGNCDYDVRHSFNGNYVYQLPFHASNGVANEIIGGWQISGDLFMRTGFPFSVQSAGCGNYILQGSGLCFANQVAGVNPYSKLQTIQGVTQPGQVQWLNPAAFQSVIDPSTNTCVGAGGVAAEANTPANCQYGTLGRNTLFGPGFFWSDFFLTKRFKLTERVALRIDGQFYNVFNHPNFNVSGTATAGIPSVASTFVGFGTLDQEVKPPTGLLGAGLGGDNAVRMISFQARLEF